MIDASDITYIGTPLPKFTYGITNTFQFGNIDVSVFLQGSYGARIFNLLRWQLEKMDNAFYNQLRTVLDRYSETNTNTNDVYMSDRYVENGSYLRIKKFTIGYRLPQELTRKTLINNARIYVTVQNLYNFNNYSGYDPETCAFNNNIRLMNVDAGHYPNPRTFTAGINIEL